MDYENLHCGGRKTLFCLVGLCGLCPFYAYWRGAQAKLAYLSTFVGSAHARQKLSFWTSGWERFVGSAHLTPDGVGRKQSLLSWVPL